MSQTDPSPDNDVERVLQLYGDLLFDLCESVLWSPAGAQESFRTILKSVKQAKKSERYVENERAWILRIACNVLRALAPTHARRLSPSEQLMMDATSAVPTRLKQFDSYFHRLGIDDQVALLLRDKYGLPYSEISAAMAFSEDSLKIRRQQALRTLEEWFWDRT